MINPREVQNELSVKFFEGLRSRLKDWYERNYTSFPPARRALTVLYGKKVARQVLREFEPGGYLPSGFALQKKAEKILGPGASK